MRKLLKVNARGQVSLGNLADHAMYEATLEDGDEIRLRPVVIVPMDKLAKEDRR